MPREAKRLEQIEALKEAAGCWKDKDHPELAKGATAYVSRMRREGDKRLPHL